MHVESVAATHVGLVRPVNEDAYLTLPELMLVADGMGGHSAGDVASAIAVTTFEPLGELGPLHAADIVDAVARANSAILSEAQANPERSGMGTTLTGVAIVDEGGTPHWLVFNVGDSRVYRIADGSARQLTVDHSEIEELIVAGRLTREAARTHPLRNVITRSLGTDPSPTPDTWLVPASPDDVFLICTDGLTNEVADADIARMISAADDIHSAATALIDAAIAAGGHDNVTAVLVSARGDGSGELDAVSASTRPRILGSKTNGTH